MPPCGESVLERMSSEYYELTSSEKKIVDYIMQHRMETQDMSISQLAEACGVAEATVSRFCRRLGSKGYGAFRLALANSTARWRQDSNPLSGEVLEDDSIGDMCQKLYAADMGAMAQTLELIRPEDIRAAADLLAAAGKVLCMGQGGSMIIAMEAAHLFSTTNGKFFPISDSHSQVVAAALMDPGDVVLYFSYSGAARDMLDTLRLVREREGKSVLITHYPRSPGAMLADVVLQCGANESPMQLGSVAARIAQMFLLDVLFSELSRRNLDGCRASRRRVADALAEKHI